jgi:hypothetical protein
MTEARKERSSQWVMGATAESGGLISWRSGLAAAVEAAVCRPLRGSEAAAIHPGKAGTTGEREQAEIPVENSSLNSERQEWFDECRICEECGE